MEVADRSGTERKSRVSDSTVGLPLQLQEIKLEKKKLAQSRSFSSS